ncbi:MAG TPA: hypothetical protein VN031_01615 [Candidatus Microsaccharimonas sp.]|nr:hypothetical protein [Candidatus Microsaccharimonas sp.]
MKSSVQDSRGFVHHFALLGVIVGVVVVGAFVLVLHVGHKDASSATIKTNNQTASKQSTNAAKKSTATTAVTPPNTTVIQTPTKQTTPKSSTSTATTSPSKTSTSNSTSTAPASTPPAAPTPLSVLTALITSLQNGTAEAQVTASAVAVAGPISTAQARPIVFTANGQTYFAYTQGTAPDFNQSASAVAASMAITTGSTSGVSLVSAGLDKAGKLTSIDYQYVGYSTGGN